MKKIPYLWLFISLMMFLSCLTVLPSKGAGNFDVVYVDDDYDESQGLGGNYFDTITEGIEAVRERGRVVVSEGTYYEHLVISKSITLEGAGAEGTIIDGTNNGDVIQITANQVTITNFTIQRSGSVTTDAGIHLISASNCLIDSNVIKQCSYGMYLEGSSSNQLRFNTILATTTALHLKTSNGNRIYQNNLLKNSMRGIYVVGVGQNNAFDNTIYENNIVDNGEAGIILHLSTVKNTVSRNNFITNLNNAIDMTQQANLWNSTSPAGGNYWSDYEGVDTSPHDGFGDTPYTFGWFVLHSDMLPYIAPLTLNNSIPLEIHLPSSVYETSPFDILVTAYDIPIANVDVLFHEEYFITGSDGKVTVTAPRVSEDTILMISCSKQGYDAAQKTITVLNSEQQLILQAPASVQEGEQFQVTVTANGVPVETVTMTFQTQTVYTNQNGVADLTAPLVDEDISIPLQAEKVGYLPASTTITILNQVPTEPTGWMYGAVVDMSGLPLSDVQVCVIPSGESKGDCVATNQLGTYTLEISPGTYQITAEKDGYLSASRDSIIVTDHSATEINFVLQTSPPEQQTTGGSDAIDYAIRWAAEKGIVGAKMSFSAETLTNTTIYDHNLTVEIIPSELGSLSFTVSAPSGTPGKVIACKIDNADTFLNTKLVELKDIGVQYDGAPIPMATSYDAIFEPSNGDTTSSWAAVVTGQNVTIVLKVPHFSEHTVMIYSLVEPVNVLTILLLYCGFGILAGIFFISRFYAGPLYQTYLKKRGKQ